MPSRNRPAKRVLNRWSDDLDKGVLLCVQYACAEAGLKIPWARVAALMGPTFTEGSIVQHLAKLRNLMAQHGIPVPPAVKRGMITKEPSKIYTNASNKAKVEPIAPMFPDSPSVKQEEEGEDRTSIYDKPKRGGKKEAQKEAPAKKEPAKSKGKGKGKAKSRRRIASDEDDDQEPNPDLYDSDDEYRAPKRRRSGNNRSKKKQDPPETFDAMPPVEAVGADEQVAVKLEEQELTGPASRTRGIKRNYSVMAAPSDDEAEVDDENPEYMDEDVEGGYGGTDDSDENAKGASIDDNMDEASSEVSTVVLEDNQANPGSDSNIPRQQIVADVPYGQIITAIESAPTTASFGHFNTPTARNYSPHGHIGVGITSHNSYSGPQLGYSGAAVMGTMPQAYPASQFPSMSMYGSSTDSSRNNSIGADMMYPTLPSMSDDEFLTAHTGFGHSNIADVISEDDMMNSIANADIFWNEGDYLVDDDA